MVRLRFLSLALGNLFFIKSPWIAGLFWLALLRDIRFPIFAFMGLAVAEAVAWGLGIGEPVKRAGALRSNAIFASLAVAWLTTGNAVSLELQIVMIRRETDGAARNEGAALSTSFYKFMGHKPAYASEPTSLPRAASALSVNAFPSCARGNTFKILCNEYQHHTNLRMNRRRL